MKNTIAAIVVITNSLICNVMAEHFKFSFKAIINIDSVESFDFVSGKQTLSHDILKEYIRSKTPPGFDPFSAKKPPPIYKELVTMQSLKRYSFTVREVLINNINNIELKPLSKHSIYKIDALAEDSEKHLERMKGMAFLYVLEIMSSENSKVYVYDIKWPDDLVD